MKARLCDRCDKRVSGKWANLKIFDNLDLSQEPDQLRNPRERDLCTACAADFEQWLKQEGRHARVSAA